MSLQRKASRFLVIALSTAISTTTLIPALPAGAAPEPPFEIRFPQETGPTVFTSTFGAPRSGGRSHTGNDLMAPKMTQVYAAADGIVTVIGTSSLAGRYVEIDHGDGWTTRYIHLNNDEPGTDNGGAEWTSTVVPGLVVGSLVVAGEHIAWVGDSGNAEGSGSHTHFEIAYAGSEIDPFPYLKAAYVRDRARQLEDVWQYVHPGDVNRMS
ncbi:MAG TPA: M23 family metallopeptidase [Acidimicrobiia bacterium]